MSKEFNALVNADLLHAVSLFMSNEETRYYLRGVQIEPHPNKPGALLVATDGHRMLIAHDPEAVVTESGIIPVSKAMIAELAQSRKKYKSIKQDDFGFILDGKTARIAILGQSPCNAAILPAERIDGSFPDWRRVVKTKHEGENKLGLISFNAEYALSFAKAEAIASSGFKPKDCQIQIWSSNNSDPMIIRFSDPRLHGILMPVRGPSEYSAPDFL
jgi:DNA polymerase III sliding clamp (beta) subunit (PCNA family)